MTDRPFRGCRLLLLLAAFGAASHQAAIAGDHAPVRPQASAIEAAVPQSLLLGFLADHSVFTLIDARSPEEYAEAHIDGAINIPHDQLAENTAALPASLDGTVVIYCRTGRRAGELKARLAERGYTDVRVLQPEQIFSGGGRMVFACGLPASKSPAVDASEEVEIR